MCRFNGGAGALQLPNLGAVIARNEAEMPWPAVMDLLLEYAEAALQQPRSDYLASRLKQWLVFLKQQYVEAAELFSVIRTIHDTDTFITQVQHAKTKWA